MTVFAPITQAGPEAGRGAGAGGAATGEGDWTRAGEGGSAGFVSGLPKIPKCDLQETNDTRPRDDVERATGFEPATPSLGSSYSTS
jgi:hypothetical protein